MTRLLVELCAGTAALSWSLSGARFPVSRMGSKAGYAEAIRGVLQIHEPPGALLWVEPDVELARTLALLVTQGGPAAVAEVIRSWIPCPLGHVEGGEACDDCRAEDGRSTGKQDARRLWERLRRERPEASPEREGAWLNHQARTHPGAEHKAASSAFLPEMRPGHWCPENPRPVLAGRVDKLAPLPATVLCGRAEEVDVGEVAGWLYWRARTYPGAENSEFRPEWDASIKADGVARGSQLPRPALAAAADVLPALPATVYAGPAEDVQPRDFASGECVVYIDPPYQGTTGYAHSFDRPAVLAVARRWHEAGATVCISEAEPLHLGAEWHHAEITDARRGQRRTFSRQQREWLTLNREPVPRYRWPARDALQGQQGLFA